MKKITLLCYVLFITIATTIAQEIDSAWTAKTYFPRLLKNAGKMIADPGDLVDINGNKISLAALKGKILYIDVWSTTCAPCISAFPHGQQLYNRLAALRLDTAIQFITICTDGPVKDWKNLVRKHQPTGLNVYSAKADKQWKINVYPTYIVVDAKGKIMSGDAISPLDGYVDFMLYAATKGIAPAKAIWQEYRQYKYCQVNKKYTDDAEGRDYAKWFAAVMPCLLEYSQWRDQKEKYNN